MAIPRPAVPIYSPLVGPDGIVHNAAWLEWFKAVNYLITLDAITGALLAINNLSDLDDVGEARSNLGLGATDAPQFAGLRLTGLDASALVGTDASKNLVSVDFEDILSAIGLGPEDSPTFAGLTIDNLTGILRANFGSVGVAGMGPSIYWSGSILNTVQNIRTTDSPTFQNLQLSGYLTVDTQNEVPDPPAVDHLRLYGGATEARPFLETIGPQGIKLRLARDNVYVVTCGEAGGVLKGQSVIFCSPGGPIPCVRLADASDPDDMPCVGIMLEDVAYTESGLMMRSGRLSGINTSAFTAGDTLFVDTTPGGITNSLPVYPNEHHRIGAVLAVGTTDGEMLVDIGTYAPEFKFKSGIENRFGTTLSYASGILTVNFVDPYDIWTNGRRWHIASGNFTVAIPDNLTFYYVYFDKDSVLQASTTPWDITGTDAPVATVYRITDSIAAVGDERHDGNRNPWLHKWAHETIGARYDSVLGGLTGSFTDTTFSVNAGGIHDEDLQHLISTKTVCRRWYRSGSAMTFDDNQTTLYKLNGTNIQYDNAGVLTDANNNYYVNHYVYATNDTAYPIYSQLGQNQYTTIAEARNATPPSFANLLTVEWKLLYKVIYRNTGNPPTYQEAIDYRLASGLAVNFIPTSHSSLTGLTADDHEQYLNEARHTAIGNSSPHHAPVTLDANALALLSLSTQQIGMQSPPDNSALMGSPTPTVTDVAPHNMTTNSAPAPYVASAINEYPGGYWAAYKAFDGTTYYWCTQLGTAYPHWLKLDLGAGNAKILKNYSLRAYFDSATAVPKDWQMQGSNNDVDFYTIDTVTGQTGWGSGEIRNFTCDDITTAYRYFRILISANNGSAYTEIGEMYLYAGTVAYPTFRSIVSADFPATLEPSIKALTLSDLTASRMVVTDANKKLISGTNTDADVADAVSKKHVLMTIEAGAAGGDIFSFPVPENQIFRLVAQDANKAWLGPASGAATFPAFRALVEADLPAASETAKGAIEIATEAETKTGTDTTRAVTPANLAAVVDSMGLGRNALINGAFDIWQRGTSIASPINGQYHADRWFYGKNSAGAHTIEREQAVFPDPATAGGFFRNTMKISCTTADTSVDAADHCTIQQKVEGYNFRQFVGRYGTLSFWIRSSKTGTMCISFANTGSNKTYVAETTISSANTWEKKTITVLFNDGGGTWDYETGSGIAVRFCLLSGSNYQGTAGAWSTSNLLATSNQTNFLDSDTNVIYLAGVQFEPGSRATIFAFRNFSHELELCERYYQIYNGAGGAFNTRMYHSDASNWQMSYLLRKAMRTTPTITKNGTWTVSNCGQPSVTAVSPNMFYLTVAVTGAGLFQFVDSTGGNSIVCVAEL